MAPPLIVRAVLDAAGYLKVSESVVSSNTAMADSALGMGADFTKSAEAQVAAGAKVIASQRAQLAQLKVIQGEATAGTDRRIAADAAVAKAQASLNRSLGITAVSTRGAAREAQTAERDFGKLSRGLLAGSGAASSLGRSLAFASTGFIAVAGGATLIASSIKASLDLLSTQRSVETQLKTSGKSWDQYGARINAVDLRLSHISGFTNQELLQSFGYLVRVTGNVGTALRLNAVAADVARGRHIALASASLALGKALGGSVTALRRLGIVIPPGVKGMAALNYVAEKFRGQAAATATVSDRFHASLVDTEETIGGALLPTFERLTTRLTNYLTKMVESGRLQRDVNGVISVGATIFHTLGGAIKVVDDATGGFANSLKLVAEAWVGLKIAGAIRSLEAMAVAWGLVGDAAEGAAAKEGTAVGVGSSRVGLAGIGAGAGRAAAIEPVAIPIVVLLSDQKTRSGLGKQIHDLMKGEVAKGVNDGIAVSSSAIHALHLDRVNLFPALKPISQLFGFIATHFNGPRLFNPPPFERSLQQGGTFQPSFFNLPFGATQPKPLPVPGFNTFGFGAAWAKYVESLSEQIAVAQAAMTKSLADDVAAARSIISRIKRLFEARKILPGTQAYLQALQAWAGAQATIDSADQAAAQKRQQAAAKALQIASTYTTPLSLQIAQVQADFTKSTKDDAAILRQIIADAKRALASGKKNKQGQLAALQIELQAKQALDALSQQTATSFTLPLKQQLALAKAQATGVDQTPILEKMKRTLEKALKAAKGNIQKQIDIWNQIASINQQLGNNLSNAYGDYRKASTRWLTAGLGLTPDERRKLRQRLSQIGPGGTHPESGVGAAGFIINPDTGRPEHLAPQHHRGSRYRTDASRTPKIDAKFSFDIYIDGAPVEAKVTARQQRRRRHQPTQTRGPHAGTSVA